MAFSEVKKLLEVCRRKSLKGKSIIYFCINKSVLLYVYIVEMGRCLGSCHFLC
jgi:hypothetical protein